MKKDLINDATDHFTKRKGAHILRFRQGLYNIIKSLVSGLINLANGIRNIMEDQYALKPALWQTSLFRLQNVKLMMTTYNNLLMLETSR